MDGSVTLRYEVRSSRAKMISYEAARPKLEMFTHIDDFEVSKIAEVINEIYETNM